MMAAVMQDVRIELPKNGQFGKVHEVVDGFFLSEDQMNQIMAVMESEMKLGLSRNPEDRKKSSLQMENTFVHETMDGTEHGSYLALDLGGTNFRVLYVEMKEGRVTDRKFHYYVIPDEILTGKGVALFEFLAESIAILIQKEGITSTEPIPLGFTFSFPMVQSALNSALLLTWTKKFKCTDTVMEDVVLMLEQAIERRGDINVHVVAILNDAVGTMMAGAYEDHNCGVGMIMGTGCNASYIEYLDRVDKWTGDKQAGLQEIIDIEWGAFGDNGVLDFFKMKYDFQMDQNSNHVGSFTFEKLFAGLFLGELVRLTMSDLTNQGLMFDSLPESETRWVHQIGTFPTGYVSDIESESPASCEKARSVLRRVGIQEPSDDDMAVLRYICALVSNRAAKIVTSVLCVLLRHIHKEKVTIAVDGSLFEQHPTIRPQMQEIINYLHPETEATFILVKDGSGMGAAFVAAVADRMEKKGLISTTHREPQSQGETSD